MYYKVCATCKTFRKFDNVKTTARICVECGDTYVLACPKCSYAIINPKRDKYCYKCGEKYPWVER